MGMQAAHLLSRLSIAPPASLNASSSSAYTPTAAEVTIDPADVAVWRWTECAGPP